MASPLSERSTLTETAGFPSTKYVLFASVPDTEILATSPTNSFEPSAFDLIIIFSISSALLFSIPVLTLADPPATSPAGSASAS